MSPSGRDFVSRLPQQELSAHEVAYLSVLVELHDYPDRVDLDDPDQAHNVGVVQVFHQAFGQPHTRGSQVVKDYWLTLMEEQKNLDRFSLNILDRPKVFLEVLS